MNITFSQHLCFENNTGTAVWAVASKLHFSCSTTVLFAYNTGVYGGAISIMSSSILFVHDNTFLKFVKNKAFSRGGAIFVHSVLEKSYLLSVTTCPLQYKGDIISRDARNVSFVFDGNVASLDSKNNANSGNSIYVTSLHPCVFYCTVNTSAELSVENYFSCIGESRFVSCENCAQDNEVMTEGHKFTISDRQPPRDLFAIPGRVFSLPLKVLDDLNNDVDAIYRVRVLNSQAITVDPSYDYTSNGKIMLYGPSQEKGTLLIELVGLHEVSLTVNVTLLECPPGFFMESKPIQISYGKTIEVKHCTCGHHDSSSASIYEGVVCNQAAFAASLMHGYWAGYSDNTTNPQTFLTAHCPTYLCSSFKSFHQLPNHTSADLINEQICGMTRRGTLCSQCTEGYTVHYHSEKFQCKSNKLCKLGWLFYILSESCPITILFVTILVFNVSFTSGSISGFIFFAQVIDSLALNSYDISGIFSSEAVNILTAIYNLIYRAFNLEFFFIDSMSFCLWDRPSTIDILTFKLVSVLYALALVTFMVILIQKCNYCFQKCHSFVMKQSKPQSYIIHGLSAFLITCYVQCARISFTILNPIYLQTVNSTSYDTVVQYNGDIKYFSLQHLPYAVPALLVILTIVTLPPLYLVWYPSGRKLQSLCHLSESRAVQVIENVLMIDRMKPLLDSFQSSFKDKYRFFAGLFFLYRTFALATFTIARTLPQFFLAVVVGLIVIIALHAAIRPHQKSWHNIVDIFILSDIAIIYALSLYIYVQATDLNQMVENSRAISVAITIRLLLIYLPLVYAILYISVVISKHVKEGF